jgi:MFS family permease
MFVILLIIMIPLATTELGVDSWVTDLMTPVMGANAGWVLVYTSFIMMVLRFCAGPLVHRLSPLGLLATCSAIAAAGLIFLSKAEAAVAIFLAATAYGVGKTFFWPTMLGIVAERFPRGGSLTLNTIGGVGMLGVGVVGTVLLGNIQDREVDRNLAVQYPAVHEQVVGEAKMSVFGSYRPVHEAKLKAASTEAAATVHQIQAGAKKSALKTVAVFPVFMFLCYLGLILYFKARGGYQAEVLAGHGAEDKKFTGGATGPADL